MSNGDLRRAQERLTAKVIDRPGVTGVSVGVQDGKPCLTVHVEDRSRSGALPISVDGVPVVVEESGRFGRQETDEP